MLFPNSFVHEKNGPSEHVPHLKDTKICYINIRGRQFAGLPFELDLKLKVEDGPNSAGIMLDVIRMIKIAKDNGLGGNVPAINAFAFKVTPIQRRGIAPHLPRFFHRP